MSPHASGWTLYGATGVTGRLVLAEALARGHRPRLAGRPSEALVALARETGLEATRAALDDSRALHSLLAATPLVLHAAGPYALTGPPMLEAAMTQRTHYVDVDGEPDFLRTRLAADEVARQAGITLVGGAGFGVIVAEGMAMHLRRRLPTAHALRIGVAADFAQTSDGAARSLAVLRGGGRRIEAGRIVPCPLADVRWHQEEGQRTRIHFAAAPLAELLPLARLSEVREAVLGVPMSPWVARALRLLSPVLPTLLALRPERSPRHSRRDPESAPAGKLYRSRVWARAEDRQGRSVEAHFETGEAYAFAARAAVRSVEAVLAAEARPGAWTPGAAFGDAFLSSIAGGCIVDDSIPAAQVKMIDPRP